MKTVDISVTGSWGLYAIAPQTTKGHAWVKKHLSQGERTVLRGAVMCEDSRVCREIVAASVEAGLRVEVNGMDMKGYRQ